MCGSCLLMVAFIMLVEDRITFSMMILMLCGLFAFLAMLSFGRKSESKIYGPGSVSNGTRM